MKQLQMLKSDGKRFPDTLPDGYSYVTHRNDLVDDWLFLSGLIGGNWTKEDFQNKMLGREGIYPEGIFYIIDGENEIIGTATGIIDTTSKKGNLHMVAVKESHRSKGLSVPLCAKVVNYLLDNEMEKIDLSTDDFRIPAIKAYLKLGFIPLLIDDTMSGRWRELAEKINYPKILEYLD